MLKEILIVDGYNIIYAWPELKEMITEDIAAARHALIEILRNYQGYREGLVTVVFDAYQTAANEIMACIPGVIDFIRGQLEKKAR